MFYRFVMKKTDHFVFHLTLVELVVYTAVLAVILLRLFPLLAR
jgi:hypothetical protein